MNTISDYKELLTMNSIQEQPNKVAEVSLNKTKIICNVPNIWLPLKL